MTYGRERTTHRLTGGKRLHDLREGKDYPQTYGREKIREQGADKHMPDFDGNRRPDKLQTFCGINSLLFLSMREGEPTVKNIFPMLQISSFFNYFNTRNASLSSFVRFLTEQNCPISADAPLWDALWASASFLQPVVFSVQ